VFAVAVLTFVLAASSPQHVFAGTWLWYDDGTPEAGWAYGSGTQVAVRFSLPSELPEAQVLTASYYIYGGSASFGVHVYDASLSELTPPGITTKPSSTGWWNIDLSGYRIIVTGDFYVSMEWISTSSPYLGGDATYPAWDGRSWIYTNGVWEHDDTDFIRAEVGPPAIGAPVGGVVMPANTLAITAPWLAIIGLVGCIGTVVAVAKSWKKPEN
jgi:hypothetical protein